MGWERGHQEKGQRERALGTQKEHHTHFLLLPGAVPAELVLGIVRKIQVSSLSVKEHSKSRTSDHQKGECLSRQGTDNHSGMGQGVSWESPCPKCISPSHCHTEA